MLCVNKILIRNKINYFTDIFTRIHIYKSKWNVSQTIDNMIWS